MTPRPANCSPPRWQVARSQHSPAIFLADGQIGRQIYRHCCPAPSMLIHPRHHHCPSPGLDPFSPRPPTLLQTERPAVISPPPGTHRGGETTAYRLLFMQLFCGLVRGVSPIPAGDIAPANTCCAAPRFARQHRQKNLALVPAPTLCLNNLSCLPNNSLP